MCGPWTSSINLTWGSVRNASSQAHPHQCPGICTVTGSQGASSVSFEKPTPTAPLFGPPHSYYPPTGHTTSYSGGKCSPEMLGPNISELNMRFHSWQGLEGGVNWGLSPNAPPPGQNRWTTWGWTRCKGWGQPAFTSPQILSPKHFKGKQKHPLRALNLNSAWSWIFLFF